jgi:PAS domain S-box-containing protein
VVEEATKNRRPKRSLAWNPGKRIQYVLDAMPFYAMLVDSGHNILAANSAVKLDFGLSHARIQGAYCPLLIHDRNTPIAECPLAEASKKEEAVEKYVFDSLRRRWLNLAVYPTQMVTGEGLPVYLHFARDITQAKDTAEKLSRSLEHHTALCDLLQDLQYCQDSTRILEALIDKVISLSWMGMTATAVGFLVRDQALEMMAQRNLNPKQVKRCKRLVLGECLCGKVAETGLFLMCDSSNRDHIIHNEGMGQHRHAVMPISYEGRVLGILTLYLNGEEDLDAFQLDFLKAATAATGTALAEQLARETAKRIREKSVAKIISSQEDERKRVARELHDQVCQSLSAILLDVQAHGSQNESIREIARGCENRIRGLIDEVRQMAVQLRPTILDDYGLESALRRHIEELSTTQPELQIDYQYEPPQQQERRLPPPVEVGLYRIAMEALSNIVSHASASRASVVILSQPSKVLLLVEDDGCGFDYTTVRRDIDHCFGLIDMEERTSLLGGTLKIESTPRKGTTVRAEIPIAVAG